MLRRAESETQRGSVASSDSVREVADQRSAGSAPFTRGRRRSVLDACPKNQMIEAAVASAISHRMVVTTGVSSRTKGVKTQCPS